MVLMGTISSLHRLNAKANDFYIHLKSWWMNANDRSPFHEIFRRHTEMGTAIASVEN